MGTDIRELLREVADEAPPGLVTPPTLVRRAHRRMAFNVAASACTVALLVTLVFLGVHSLGSDRSLPAHPTPTTVFDRVHGWVTVGGSTITAIDPDDPAHRVVLSSTGGIPLDWSRDGTELLVNAGPGGLFVLKEDGTRNKVGPAGAAGGSFTPDGKAVVYEYRWSIYEVASTGGKPQVLLARSEASGGYVLPFNKGGQLSPDGTTIAYDNVGGHGSSGLWLIHLDGTGRRELVSSATAKRLSGTIGFQGNIPAAWSPDGTRLLFNTESKGPCVLFVINTDGTGLRRLTSKKGCNMSPSWSPDGTRIAVALEPDSVRILDERGTQIQEFGVQGEGLLNPVWNPVP